MRARFVDVRAGENQCKQAQAYLLASFLTGRPHFCLVVNLTVDVAIGDAVSMGGGVAVYVLVRSL